MEMSPENVAPEEETVKSWSKNDEVSCENNSKFCELARDYSIKYQATMTIEVKNKEETERRHETEVAKAESQTPTRSFMEEAFYKSKDFIPSRKVIFLVLFKLAMS